MTARGAAVAAALQRSATNGPANVIGASVDRRQRVRFEVCGHFTGTLEVSQPVRVSNLANGGALIEVTQPLAVESIQSISLTIDGQATMAAACVRHLTRVGGALTVQYQAGLEFLAASSAFQEAVEVLIASRFSPSELG